MRGVEFKKRALQEGLRYGEDRMVFLREFAQNSRDANASQIGIAAEFIEGQFVLTFGDNGVGMDYDHARNFLFTLYASSKENEASSAGRFGVGFWSVLLFEPTIIEIESRTDKSSTMAMYPVRKKFNKPFCVITLQ
jgi:HSP90 family molecular chaperone